MTETREEAIDTINAAIWTAIYDDRNVAEAVVAHLTPDVARVLLGADRVIDTVLDDEDYGDAFTFVDGTPEADPLAHVKVGDPDPLPDIPGACCGLPNQGGLGFCARDLGHEPWQHIASDGRRVVAVWPAVQAQPKAGERA